MSQHLNHSLELQPANVVCFNGDADGLCALKILQLKHGLSPSPQLFTGVKRDTKLLRYIPESEKPGTLTALDIGIAKNWEDVTRLLSKGWTLQWIDHHEPVPQEPTHLQTLKTFLSLDKAQNTSQIIAQIYDAIDSPWALIGMFGDNLQTEAEQKGLMLGYTVEQLAMLRRGGELVNYNAYGSSLEDLTVNPLDIWAEWQEAENPEDWMTYSALFVAIQKTYAADLEKLQHLKPYKLNVYFLPNTSWARRTVGIFANQLVKKNPMQPWAVLVDKGDGNWLVSLRVPPNATLSARDFCRQFPGGSGRALSAGIDNLPGISLEVFMESFTKSYKII